MENLKPGISSFSITAVSTQNTAAALGSGDMEVFATPAMAALMENAAMNAVAPFLPDGAATVGSRLEISHTRPSGVGERMEARATLAKIEGRRLEFEVSARDSRGEVGSGVHVRYIVDRAKFLSKL